MASPLDPVLTRIAEDFDGAVDRLRDLVRIPSVSADPAYDDRTREAADWLAADLQSIGFQASVRPTAGQPMVVAHHPGPDDGKAPHILYYGHYDVQPADPVELWDTSPFEPTIVAAEHGPRLVARGAVDDKGQVMTFIEAFRAWQKVHGSLPVRLTVFLEGEEECGSPSLEPFLEAAKDELAADVCVLSDTNMWDIETPAIATMLRGLLYVELTLQGPGHDLHSGLYGGAVPNPINVLTRVLGQLHDSDGRVQIPGFYDDVVELEAEVGQWATLDFDEAAFLDGAGLTRPTGEAGRSTLERIWSRPTCDLNGIWGGYTGTGAKTVIPAVASAKLSFRLAPDQSPDKVLAGLEAFLEARTPADCHFEMQNLGGSPAIRVPTDSIYLAAAKRALGRTFECEPVSIGMGGSIPAVEAIKRLLGTESLLVGFGLDDDRVHSPNEKFELRCFEQGIRAHAALLAEFAELGTP